ncbi:hypothetical protein BACCOPRO_00821 [Phocaeicola coprophilus DSM 18228 = JCM 13818]|uniref:Uncharacterized protein n=1 Tax=Phocaeicola coprophilus DSM 18228 = JCM 13818 TaxID=547042 RepID=S0F9V6_9BACT|nr:hypothetical protein BACCOPRO_00821 [Phocaeicola coprophilus DSM 18228 = JCM 13818]
MTARFSCNKCTIRQGDHKDLNSSSKNASAFKAKERIILLQTPKRF